MREKNTVAILRPAKIFTTAIPCARGAYRARFSVDDLNLTQMDLSTIYYTYILSKLLHVSVYVFHHQAK
jgi:hypothetical protein